MNAQYNVESKYTRPLAATRESFPAVRSTALFFTNFHLSSHHIIHSFLHAYPI